MTADALQQLYRDQVLTHSRDPINRRVVPDATHIVEGNNPLCGDKLTVYVTLNENNLTDVSFEGSGCAISIASASMLSQMLTGAPRVAAQQLVDDVIAMLKTPVDTPASLPAHPGAPVAALGAVRSYPSRIKCATLAWQATASVIATNATNNETVTTE